MKQKWEEMTAILVEVGISPDDAKQVYHMAICDLCERIMTMMLGTERPLSTILDDLRIYTLAQHKYALDSVCSQVVQEQFVNYKSMGGQVN